MTFAKLKNVNNWLKDEFFKINNQYHSLVKEGKIKYRSKLNTNMKKLYTAYIAVEITIYREYYDYLLSIIDYLTPLINADMKLSFIRMLPSKDKLDNKC